MIPIARVDMEVTQIMTQIDLVMIQIGTSMTRIETMTQIGTETMIAPDMAVVALNMAASMVATHMIGTAMAVVDLIPGPNNIQDLTNQSVYKRFKKNFMTICVSDSSVDRFGGSGYFPTTDSCLERSGYFVRTCEDTLIQRQRDAREGRSSNDVQRRICWYVLND